MRKLICVLIMTTIISILAGCTETGYKPRNPITGIEMIDSKQAIYIGEEVDLNLKIFPINSDEKYIISVEDENIIQIKNHTIKGIREGTTRITVKSETEQCKQSIEIKVIKKFNNTEYEENYYPKIKENLVKISVYSNGKTHTAYGVIVKSVNNTHYFITGEKIFSEIGNTKYGEWKVTDSYGNTYKVTKANYHIRTGINIGTFTSNKQYNEINISNENPWIGEYAVIYDSKTANRLEAYKSELLMDNTYLESVLKFSNTSSLPGAPIFNQKGELIGVQIYQENEQVTMVPPSTIKELLNAFYNKL